VRGFIGLFKVYFVSYATYGGGESTGRSRRTVFYGIYLIVSGTLLGTKYNHEALNDNESGENSVRSFYRVINLFRLSVHVRIEYSDFRDRWRIIACQNRVWSCFRHVHTDRFLNGDENLPQKVAKPGKTVTIFAGPYFVSIIPLRT